MTTSKKKPARSDIPLKGHRAPLFRGIDVRRGSESRYNRFIQRRNYGTPTENTRHEGYGGTTSEVTGPVRRFRKLHVCIIYVDDTRIGLAAENTLAFMRNPHYDYGKSLSIGLMKAEAFTVLRPGRIGLGH